MRKEAATNGLLFLTLPLPIVMYGSKTLKNLKNQNFIIKNKLIAVRDPKRNPDTCAQLSRFWRNCLKKLQTENTYPRQKSKNKKSKSYC